jgi:hypothetical protein
MRPGRLWQQAHEAHGGHAFAAAAFTDDAECLAGFQREIDIVHGDQQAVIGLETDAQITNFEKRCRHHLVPPDLRL